MADIEKILKLPKDKLAEALASLSGREVREVLQRFRPEERIAILKSLDRERAKQKEESEKIVRESIEELRREDIAKDIPIPEQKEVNISRLFERSELEEHVSGEIKEIPPEHRNPDYAAQIQSIDYAAELYNELADIRAQGSAVGMERNENPYGTLTRAAEIYEKIKDIGKYESQSDSIKNIAEGSSRLIKEIMGEYHAKQNYDPSRGR